MANLLLLGVAFHSCCQSRRVVLLDLHLVLDLVVFLKGILCSREVASFASSSALLFLGMSHWIRHQETEMDRSVWFVRRVFM